MRLFQRPVEPLPSGLDLQGKTVIITGASDGLGLETARQMLRLRGSTVVLAVRNIAKGEACKTKLAADPLVKSLNPPPTIKIMQVDMSRYESVKNFAKAVKEEIPVLDVLVLNAGIGTIKFELGPEGHEIGTQVNYLSNVLLLFELWPLLKSSTAKTQTPSRVTWVGSRSQIGVSIPESAIGQKGGVFRYVDDPKSYSPFQKYGEGKLLVTMFIYELAKRSPKDVVVVNNVCPGQVNTGMSDILPWYIRWIINIMKAIRARSVEQGGWLILHSALVVGPESHGQFLRDKTVARQEYILSSAGQAAEKQAWAETMEEMSTLTDVPVEFRNKY